MARGLSLGIWCYDRAGKFAPLLGPLLWTLAMTSTLLHVVGVSLALSVGVLYYNVSISSALRRRVRDRDAALQQLSARLSGATVEYPADESFVGSNRAHSLQGE